MAYAINGTKEVFVHKEWNAGKYGVSVKPKTIVLLDEDEDVLAFGKAAKDMFSDILCKLWGFVVNIILNVGIYQHQRRKPRNGCYLRDLKWHYMMVWYIYIICTWLNTNYHK